jgi:hypothetical protein
MTTLYDAATAYRDAGLSFFPTKEKQPDFLKLPKRWDEREKRKKHSWADYRERQPTADEVTYWYKQSRATELALVCGPASNAHHNGAGLFIVDVDRPSLLNAFRDACGTAWNAVARQRTRKGGAHLLMLCDGAADLHNQKLALEPNPRFVSKTATPDESKYLCLIETRGQGGYACAWPTPNYELEAGDFCNLPYAGMDDVVYPILQAAISFNQVTDLTPSLVAASQVHRDLPDTLSLVKTMIYAFRAKYSVSDMLLAYGYTPVGRNRFRRPGGKSGSAIVSDDNGIVVPFSSNDLLYQTPNALGRTFHDAFGVYMIFEHGGDICSALDAVAHDFGFHGYHRPDYSSSRDESIHRIGDAEMAFFTGDAENEALFVVDDMDSAHVLNHQGCAAFYVPSGVTDIGGWVSKCLQFPQRYIWPSPNNYSGATETLALTIDAPILASPWTAAELMERRRSAQDAFVLEVAEMISQARMPSLETSVRVR